MKASSGAIRAGMRIGGSFDRRNQIGLHGCPRSKNPVSAKSGNRDKNGCPPESTSNPTLSADRNNDRTPSFGFQGASNEENLSSPDTPGHEHGRCPRTSASISWPTRLRRPYRQHLVLEIQAPSERPSPNSRCEVLRRRLGTLRAVYLLARPPVSRGFSSLRGKRGGASPLIEAVPIRYILAKSRLGK